jgi:L-fuconolactonase
MATSSRPRLVDGHVHYWDPGRPDWYPHLQPGVTIDYLGGDISGMQLRYQYDTYRQDSAGWPVDAIVHVSAATNGRAYLAETAWLTEVATQQDIPLVVIGAIDPALSPADVAADLDEQLRNPPFRGVRVLEGLEYGSGPAGSLLRALAERDLVFDLVTHPGEMSAAAAALARFPQASYVVEHSGWPWPDQAADPGYFALWQDGMRALSKAGENVYCKLSGLPMTLHDVQAGQLRPWIEHCLEVFGPDRCLIGSNFPVDRLFGSFDALMSAYAELTAPLGPDAQQAVFAGNAARVYRITA